MSRFSKARWILPLALALAHLPAVGQGAAGSVTQEVRQLYSQGRAAEAYELARRHPDNLGDPAFDFAFGVAAIDTGHAAEGVLALERYLLALPDDAQARLELARGYYVLGEDARAREEFNNVLALKPPAPVVANIERFLDAIRLRESRYQTSTRAYVEAGLGWDTNVNGGVSSAAVSLPSLASGFNVANVPALGQRRADLATFYAGGAQITHPLAPGVTAYGGIDWDRRELRNGGTFDTETLTGNGGVSWLRGSSVYRLSATASKFWFGHSPYRTLAGVGGEWQRQLSERDIFTAGLQFAQLRYAGTNQPRDTDFAALSLGYRHQYAAAWQPVLQLGYTYGDDATTRGRQDFARDLHAIRVGVSATPAARWGVGASLTFQDSSYRGQQDLGALGVLPARSDRYTGLDVSVTYLVSNALSVRTEIALADNHSNIELFAYRRSAISMKVRYEFK